MSVGNPFLGRDGDCHNRVGGRPERLWCDIRDCKDQVNFEVGIFNLDVLRLGK